MTAASILHDNKSKNVGVYKKVVYFANVISQSQRFEELIYFTWRYIIFKCLVRNIR